MLASATCRCAVINTPVVRAPDRSLPGAVADLTITYVLGVLTQVDDGRCRASHVSNANAAASSMSSKNGSPHYEASADHALGGRRCIVDC